MHRTQAVRRSIFCVRGLACLCEASPGHRLRCSGSSLEVGAGANTPHGGHCADTSEPRSGSSDLCHPQERRELAAVLAERCPVPIITRLTSGRCEVGQRPPTCIPRAGDRCHPLALERAHRRGCTPDPCEVGGGAVGRLTAGATIHPALRASIGLKPNVVASESI